MNEIPYRPVAKELLIINFFMALLYLSWWFTPGVIGNPILFSLLLIGEIYHVFMAWTFWYTLWPAKNNRRETAPFAQTKEFSPPVDVFITVAGEPTEIVRQTILAAKNMNYPNFKTYILNDGFALKKDNWKEVELLATELGVNHIMRPTNPGAKAGNINNALRQTAAPIVVIFDADMAPSPAFLQKTIPFFIDRRVGFVQTPQYYRNWEKNYVTTSAWEQQELFFGPIMRGKDRDNAAFICGTNVAIARSALTNVGGMAEDNIAEDFLTSIRIHQQGYLSYYLPEVLATGLAPEDLSSYFKQQLRWARGSLEVAFGQNPILKRGLTWQQKLQYLSSAAFYLGGPVIFVDIVMPLIFLFTGLEPVHAMTTTFAIFFIPYMALQLYTLLVVSGGSFTFRANSFGLSNWTGYLLALKAVLLRQKTAFSVTPKTAQTGNFLFLAYPHLVYIFLAAIAVAVAIHREGFDPSVATNIAWAAFNVVTFIPFIRAAYTWDKLWTPKPSQKISKLENYA
ncbi:glycosyltransferase [Patescibacteria group bacterium]|nr:glycosyltransferase [Patescibacteria group bacterium]